MKFIFFIFKILISIILVTLIGMASYTVTSWFLAHTYALGPAVFSVMGLFFVWVTAEYEKGRKLTKK